MLFTKEHKIELFKLLEFICVLFKSHDHFSPKGRSLKQWCLYHWTFNIVSCDFFRQWFRGVHEVSVNPYGPSKLCCIFKCVQNDDNQIIPNWLQWKVIFHY